ncbi:50S ribosomal protein L11 methyltransferase [bacterium]|nr:50S ribosomal protein L11 methyltransferase [bacterium]
MKSYFELVISINPELEDVMSDFFFENFPTEGVVLAEESYKNLEMTSTTEGNLKVFLTEEPQGLDNLLKDYRRTLKDRGLTDDFMGSWDYTIDEKENQDWSKKWKEKWDVTHVTDKITVVPDWIEYTPKSKDEVIIRLEPGCAFGTGTHDTTQICMRAIELLGVKGKNVADIGMGSGILSICAKKFGAKYVYGCDNDETVIEVARENALKNNAKCEFELGTADKINKKFDFVLANILHNVLAEIMGDLKNITTDGGYIVLSGILDEKAPIVVDAINKNRLKIVNELHQNQWVGYIVEKI